MCYFQFLYFCFMYGRSFWRHRPNRTAVLMICDVSLCQVWPLKSMKGNPWKHEVWLEPMESWRMTQNGEVKNSIRIDIAIADARSTFLSIRTPPFHRFWFFHLLEMLSVSLTFSSALTATFRSWPLYNSKYNCGLTCRVVWQLKTAETGFRICLSFEKICAATMRFVPQLTNKKFVPQIDNNNRAANSK